MGIINVTPDSFSDGGMFAQASDAVAYGLQLIADGADILDVGGESTRPGFTSVDTSEELRRVIPVIKGLVEHGAIVSIDTRHAEVARAALKAGASIINDVTGFRDPAMVEVARSCDAGLVVMRTGGKLDSATDLLWNESSDATATPRASRDNLLLDEYHWRAAELGFAVTPLNPCGAVVASDSLVDDQSRIVFDPGFGFVDTYEDDLALWAQLDAFASGPYPVLVGVSRKRLIGRISGIELATDRDEASAQLAAAAVQHGAKIVRVHDVALTRRHLDTLATAPPITAYIALGSNLGDRRAYIDEAIVRIDALPATSVVACSSVIETAAQYVTDQPDFLNSAIRVETQLGLFAFFAELQSIEVAMGRVKEYDKGPRIIDIDLLLYGDVSYQTKELAVPHPLMNERDFVLQPLREITYN